MDPELEQDPIDRQIEAETRHYLASRLDGQMGRCAAHFRQHAAAAAGPAPLPQQQQPRRRLAITRRTRLWMIVGATGGAIAASIAGIWAAPVNWIGQGEDKQIVLATETTSPTTNPAEPYDDSPSSSPIASAAEETKDDVAPVQLTEVSRRTIDDGTYLVNDKIPVRKYRSQYVERTTWYDARSGIKVEQTIPREKVTLVQMAVY